MKKVKGYNKPIKKLIILITGFVVISTMLIYFSSIPNTSSYFYYESDEYQYNHIIEP